MVWVTSDDDGGCEVDEGGCVVDEGGGVLLDEEDEDEIVEELELERITLLLVDDVKSLLVVVELDIANCL